MKQGDAPVTGGPGPERSVTPTTPAAARAVFGDRLGVAEHYVALLAGTGIAHGLIGPREADRLWERHTLNSAVVQPGFERGATVADVGSGAGLPGIPLAIARPDLQITLVEPLARRTTWLDMAVGELGLHNVFVHRGRAESLWGVQRFRHVTARAVARIAELARVTLPLLEAGGSLLALKGERAEQELADDAAALVAMGPMTTAVLRFGAGVIEPETVVLSIAPGRLFPVPRGRSARGRQERPRPRSDAPATD